MTKLIKQALVGANFFKQGFLSKYRLKQYNHPGRPAIFFGCYPKQVNLVAYHQTPAVVVWLGTDALYAKSKPEHYALVLGRTDLRHIALSQMVSNTLGSIGIENTIVPLTPFTYEGFEPTAMGRHAYFYNPNQNPQLYGRQWVAKASPLITRSGVSLYHSTTHNIVREEMPWVYSQCFCNLRLTSHDGLSNTVVEMALMGRHSLWNNPVPGATPWKDEFDIIRFVERERQRQQPDLQLREEMLDYLNVGNDWMRI